MVDGALRDPAREAALHARDGAPAKRGLKDFKWFIYRFTTPTMKHLFNIPRNVLQVEQAVISMLAGDVFDDRHGAAGGCASSALIYAITALRIAPAALRGWWRRRRQVAPDVSGDTLQAGNAMSAVRSPPVPARRRRLSASTTSHADDPSARCCARRRAGGVRLRRLRRRSAMPIRVTCACRCSRMRPSAPFEVWRTDGPVRSGRDGEIALGERWPRCRSA